MPTISWFFGISIRMYLTDHPPPHFHAYYESSVAIVDIRTGAIIVGRLPPRIARLVERWRRMYTAELMEAWARAERGESGSLGRIPGLDKK
tara:strand:+ start:373 stop:645 length:273 start_codon:yes stop_codon:yes gene_type:complete